MKWNVKVGDKTLVEDLIRLAIQQYEMECHDKKKTMNIKMNPKAYVLRFAEDDGAADVIPCGLIFSDFSFRKTCLVSLVDSIGIRNTSSGSLSRNRTI